MKERRLENEGKAYNVHYASGKQLHDLIVKTLDQHNGLEGFRNLNKGQLSTKLALFYGDIDYLHPSREGNSRTLRTFTRMLCKEIGYELDWSTSNIDAKMRNTLYVARDREVICRDVLGVDLETASKKSPNEVKDLVYVGSKKSKTLKSIIHASLRKLSGRRLDSTVNH